MESFLNCFFTAIALPIGLFLLGSGVYQLIKGDPDQGVFLLVLAALLLGAVGSGYVGHIRKKRRQPGKKTAAKTPSKKGKKP